MIAAERARADAERPTTAEGGDGPVVALLPASLAHFEWSMELAHEDAIVEVEHVAEPHGYASTGSDRCVKMWDAHGRPMGTLLQGLPTGERNAKWQLKMAYATRDDREKAGNESVVGELHALEEKRAPRPRAAARSRRRTRRDGARAAALRQGSARRARRRRRRRGERARGPGGRAGARARAARRERAPPLSEKERKAHAYARARRAASRRCTSRAATTARRRRGRGGARGAAERAARANFDASSDARSARAACSRRRAAQ